MNYVIVDIETTGGSPKSSKITEIALYKHDGEKIVDEFITLINPEILIPEFIIRLTGITNSMVENQPRFFEVAKKIIEFTQDCIFVAHNVGFDYGIIRQEFKSLGYDFRLPHLCTVRAARIVFPGLPSYSLGKLARNLNIIIEGRHRAGGDALATAHLFTMLIKQDKKQLSSFIQEEINPKILHPNLDIDTLDNLPSKTGIYKFFNENNQLIYIGKSKHIKQRVDQHLRNSKTKKGIQMRGEIMRIEFEITGSELIALFKESQLIKKHKPIFNQQLKKSKYPFGIYDYIDDLGYLRLYIDNTSKKQAIPLSSFSNKKEAIASLTYWCEEYQLCQKLCDLYTTKNACFHYTIKKCLGACINEENVDIYNDRVNSLVNKLTFEHDHFYVIDKGRQKTEKSIIYINKGRIIGFGYAPFHFNHLPPTKWERFIERITEDRDAKQILLAYLRKGNELKITHL
jgi:DNA polymerase-3 subunit epsilon